MAKRTTPIRLTREQATAGASAQSIARGEDYAASGAVLTAIRQGDILRGQVAGSDLDSYNVMVRLKPRAVVDADCSCPYDWGGHCKHIVALLLRWVEAPETFVEQAPMADLLAQADAAAMRKVLLAASETVAGFDAWLRAHLPAGQTRKAAASGRSAATPVDRASYEAKVRQLLRNVRGVGYYSDAPERVLPVLGDAEDRLRLGDAGGAVQVLLALTAPLVTDFEAYEGECEVDEFLRYKVVPLLAHALRAADIPEPERSALAAELADWDSAFSRDYGSAILRDALQALGATGPGRI